MNTSKAFQFTLSEKLIEVDVRLRKVETHLTHVFERMDTIEDKLQNISNQVDALTTFVIRNTEATNERVSKLEGRSDAIESLLLKMNS